MSSSSIIDKSYVGAGNVRKKYSGLKTHIIEQAPRAVHVRCSAARRSNLVIKSVLKCSPD